MPQKLYTGADRAKEALLDKIQPDLTELYETSAEVDAARKTEPTLLDQVNSLQAQIDTIKIIATTGFPDQTNKTGYLRTKDNLPYWDEDTAGTLVSVQSDVDRVENNLTLNLFKTFDILTELSQVGYDTYEDGWADVFSDAAQVDIAKSAGWAFNSGTHSIVNRDPYYEYPLVNKTAEVLMYSTSTTKVSQIINLPAGDFQQLHVPIRKIGNPSGLINTGVYSISGTPGVDAIPSGAALILTADVDASAVSSESELVSFTFATPASTPTSAWRALVISYAGGDTQNYIAIGVKSGLTAPFSDNLATSTDGVSYSVVTSKRLVSYIFGGLQNMVLVFDSYETEVEPKKAKVLAITELEDQVSLNTALKVWSSNNDGASYEQVIMADAGVQSVKHKIIVGEKVLPATGAKTTRLKFTMDNTKEVKIHAVSNLLKEV